MALAVIAGLGGCQGGGTIGAGEDLFHGLEGGAIAAQRPPPPGVKDPYPSLHSIPDRPAPPDILAEQTLSDQLAAQRDQAEAQAAANPLTPRAPPPALPKATPPDPNANRVLVDAAPTPPAPPAKPAPAAPAAAAPAASAPLSPGAIPSLASVPAVVAPVVSGPLPTLAAAPPPGPVGLGILPATLVPTGPPGPSAPAPAASPVAAAPAPAPAPPAPAKPLLDTLFSNAVVPITPGDTIYHPPAIPVAATVQVSFTPGSAQLPPSASLNLRRFALAHKGVPVSITGHGEAAQPGVDAQGRALDLALRRAQAIAASLATDGIPPVNLHLRAEAAGQGGSVGL